MFETDYDREKAYCCVTQRYCCILNCVVNLLSLGKSKLANREFCMVNLLSGSLNEGQLN